MEHKTRFEIKLADLNSKNTLFGGKLMAEMDLCGAFAAENLLKANKRFMRSVFVRNSNINFYKPAYMEEWVDLDAEVMYATGKSSIKVFVQAKVDGNLIASGHFIYVSIDDKTLKKKKHGIHFNADSYHREGLIDFKKKKKI
jgi:acyl-CoA hydrolase